VASRMGQGRFPVVPEGIGGVWEQRGSEKGLQHAR
jgi:hypothetical protein